MNFTLFHHHYDLPVVGAVLIGVLILWELFWKGLALWRAGRNRQPAWFVVMLLLNTVGLLEIAYLLFFQRNREDY